MDWLQARNSAYRLATTNYEPGKSNFSKYSSIYLAPTSNVKGTLQLYHGYESVLTVGGMGAHGFEAALNGAKKIDMFDINELQKIFYELVKTAIIYLDYKDFIKFFTLKEQKNFFRKEDIKDLISNEMYQLLGYFLPEEVHFVLGPLFEFFQSPDLIISSLFRFEHPVTLDYLKRFVSFYNEDDYKKLQALLRSGACEINYHIVPIQDVPQYFKDKYDLVLLDNILQFYQKIPSLETPYNVNQFIQKQLIERVNEGGAIQVNYGFGIATQAFQKNFNLPEDYKFNSNTMLMREKMKNDINSRLYGKWDRYEYNFIPGVEKPYEKTSNMVLTLRKK